MHAVLSLIVAVLPMFVFLFFPTIRYGGDDKFCNTEVTVAARNLRVVCLQQSVWRPYPADICAVMC